MAWPSQQPGYAPNAAAPAAAAAPPQIGDTKPAPVATAPAPQGGTHSNDTMPEGTGQPAAAPEGAPPGTGTPATTETKTPQEAEAVEGITDIGEANEIIRKLRDENARRRVANSDVNSVLADANPAERQNMLDFLAQLRTDPVGSRERLQEMISQIDEFAEAGDPASANAEGYLTHEEVDARMEAKRVEWDKQAKISAFEQRAVSLGYDADSPDYGKVLAVAAREFSGTSDPIGSAHEKIQSDLEVFRQQAIADYVAGVQQGVPSTVPTGTGAPPAAAPVLVPGSSAEGEKPSWEGARASARARLAGVAAGAANNPLA